MEVNLRPEYSHLMEEEEDEEVCLATVSSPSFLQVCCSCNRGKSLSQTVVTIRGRECCTLLDTGAQICLLSDRVVQELQKQEKVIIYELEGTFIWGLGPEKTQIQGLVKLPICIAGVELRDVSFAVVGSQDIPYCVVMGVNIIKRLDLKMDFSQRTCLIGMGQNPPSLNFLHPSCGATASVQVCLVQSDLATSEGQEEEVPAAAVSSLLGLDLGQLPSAQQKNYTTKLLYNKIVQQSPPHLWKPKCLQIFK